ncbi:Cupin superfamily protein [compost metagenome]
MPQKPVRRSSKPALLDQKFWSHFAKNIWEQKPLVLKNVKSDLLEMGDAAIFDLLVLYSNRCRKLKNPEGFKFYINGLRTDDQDVLQVLPVKKDKTLLGYHARMNEMFSDYCLVCDELLKANLEKQALLTDFTDELYRHVGFPNRFSEMGLYLGNYRKTPFGVHMDRCGVFSFPVAGVKKFRLWTSAFVKKNPKLDRAFEYGKYKKDSQLMEVGPGDMTYWPSSAWHIAESDGSFSATWSLGVWVDQPHKETFSQSLKGLLDEKLGTAGAATATSFKTLHESSGEVTQLPAAYLQSIELLQGLTSLELQETFLKSWMVHISQQGFKTIPQVDFKLGLKSQIRLRNVRAPILWQQGVANKGKFFFGFGGVLVECTKSSGLLKLVKALNAGESCLISKYLTGTTKPQDLKSLQSLAAAGAFC